MVEVKYVEEEISLAILENGRTCQFRTVAAAERMKEFVERIQSKDIYYLDIVELDDNKFDIQFNDIYLENLCLWISKIEPNFNVSQFKKANHFCIEFRMKDRLCRIAPYAAAIHISEKGLDEWKVGSFDLHPVPKNEEDFNNVYQSI